MLIVKHVCGISQGPAAANTIIQHYKRLYNTMYCTFKDFLTGICNFIFSLSLITALLSAVIHEDASFCHNVNSLPLLHIFK